MRILLSMAMISILVISPMISKCIVDHYTFTLVTARNGVAARVCVNWQGCDSPPKRKKPLDEIRLFCGVYPKSSALWNDSGRSFSTRKRLAVEIKDA